MVCLECGVFGAMFGVWLMSRGITEDLARLRASSRERDRQLEALKIDVAMGALVVRKAKAKE
jgi:hypothetical protein